MVCGREKYDLKFCKLSFFGSAFLDGWTLGVTMDLFQGHVVGLVFAFVLFPGKFSLIFSVLVLTFLGFFSGKHCMS